MNELWLRITTFASFIAFIILRFSNDDKNAAFFAFMTILLHLLVIEEVVKRRTKP
jgi:hypothetical protein